MSTKPKRTSPRLYWLLGFCWASLVAIWIGQYRVFYYWPPLTGGDAWGLGFGIAGTVLILASAFYSVRKAHLDWWVGSLPTWLDLHVYLGTLALVLIVAHSGYRWHATVPNLALLFLFLVVASGLVGAWIYRSVPPLKAERLRSPVLPEVVAERLSEINQQLSELCSGRGAAWLALYNDLVIPLYRSRGREPAEISPDPGLDDAFEFGEAEDYARAVKLLKEAKSLFSELDLHLRFLRRLRLWLYVHVPVSVGLIVFSAAHVVSVLRYRY
jgi:hypothetical protein